MPIIQPTHGSALSALLHNAHTPEGELGMAKFILKTVDDYARPTFPDRPAALVLEDHEILDAYQMWEHGTNLSADKKRALAYFSAWRVLVWQAEARAGMKLFMLVNGARVFEAREMWEEGDLLLAYAESEYPGFVRQDCPEGLGWIELREWSLKKARDYALLPGFMRIMKQPKGGVPFHKPQGQRGAREVRDEPLEQEKMPWDEE